MKRVRWILVSVGFVALMLGLALAAYARRPAIDSSTCGKICTGWPYSRFEPLLGPPDFAGSGDEPYGDSLIVQHPGTTRMTWVGDRVVLTLWVDQDGMVVGTSTAYVPNKPILERLIDRLPWQPWRPAITDGSS
jgi:hypothetical protein